MNFAVCFGKNNSSQNSMEQDTATSHQNQNQPNAAMAESNELELQQEPANMGAAAVASPSTEVRNKSKSKASIWARFKRKPSSKRGSTKWAIDDEDEAVLCRAISKLDAATAKDADPEDPSTTGASASAPLAASEDVPLFIQGMNLVLYHGSVFAPQRPEEPTAAVAQQEPDDGISTKMEVSVSSLPTATVVPHQSSRLLQLPSSHMSTCTEFTQVEYIHCLVPDLNQITNSSFYWGVMDRYEAERLLDNKPEGTFLLRDSAQEDFLFSVSFRRYSRSLHARVDQDHHVFSFDIHDAGVFRAPTVCSLVEHYKDPNSCMFFEPMLSRPLVRNFPFALKHLARARICQNIMYDEINLLTLPKPLKEYLKYYHYKHRVSIRKLFTIVQNSENTTYTVDNVVPNTGH